MATITEAAPLTGHTADRVVAGAHPGLAAYVRAARNLYSAHLIFAKALDYLAADRRRLEEAVARGGRLHAIYARNVDQSHRRVQEANSVLEAAQDAVVEVFDQLAAQDPALADLARTRALPGVGLPVRGVPENALTTVQGCLLSKGLPLIRSLDVEAWKGE